MAKYEDVFKALASLKQEFDRLRKVEQEHNKLKKKYDVLLKQVQKESKGFHFFTTSGVYTGYSALNIHEFSKVLQKIPLESLEIHSQKGDFENWLRFLQLNDLAAEVEKMRALKISGERLRRQLVKAVNNYIRS